MRYFFIVVLVCAVLISAGCSKSDNDGAAAKDYYKKANQFIDAGYPKEAIGLLDLAIEKDPTFFAAHYNRGVVNFLIKDYKNAIADFSRAISVDPKNSTAYASRGEVYETMKDGEKALNDYKKAAQLGSKETQGYLKAKNISW